MMNNEIFYKSVLEQDYAPIVLCDLNHIIIYMNSSAIAKYKKNLVGKSIKNCHSPFANEMIDKVVSWFSKSENNNVVYTFDNQKENKDVYMIALRNDDKKLIGYYEKHEFRTKEKRKPYIMN